MTAGHTPDSTVVALRTAGAVLVELPIPVAAPLRPWVASIWPAADGNGWGRQLWNYDQTRRGWIIPPSCDHGTIVEVGAATTAHRRQPARTHTAWYAVAIAHDQHWLICDSPTSDAWQAHLRARAITDTYRRGIVARYQPATAGEQDAP